MHMLWFVKGSICKLYNMGKIIFISIVFFSTSIYGQNVGINTNSPTRALDVNGDLRVRTLTDKSTDAAYNNVIVANTNGEFDKWDKASLLSTIQTLAVENKKLTYVSNSPNIGNTVDCGKFSFRFNTGPVPQIKLVSGNSTTIYYTIIHRVNKSTDSFSGTNTLASGQSVTIGSGTGNNSTTGWQTLDATYANNGLDELYVTYPGDNNLYRVTFLARNSSATQYFYTMICEKF